MSSSVRLASVNVNGIRAASRRGMKGWLTATDPTVLALQETRADHDVVAEVIGDGWDVVTAPSTTKGRAGVAVAVRSGSARLVGQRPTFADGSFDGQGRWIEADVEWGDGSTLTVVSTYVHTGQADDPERMAEKHAFMTALVDRAQELRDDGRRVAVCGDLNITHRDVDLKNWKGNRSKAGCLPEERTHLDRLLAGGFVDLGRRFGGDGPGPYTWWSWRGRAFDNDAGWRIDYVLVDESVAEAVTAVTVDRAPSYDERWSDHAPITVTITA
ncbi:MAG: exodeoxyribonuclease III [Microthrixaceae bacterium]